MVFIQTFGVNSKASIVQAFITVGSMMIIYYAIQKVLIPKLLIKGRKVGYIILSIALVLLFANICAQVESEIFENIDIHFEFDPKFRHIITISKFFILFLITYAASSIIFLSKKAAEDTKQKEKLLAERKTMEARVLKSQINSHFIFNALNNIYSMTYFKDEYTSGYVLKLAQMMRYVMEDCETELTPLSKEIEYIENFIDFQKLRFENDKNIRFTYNIDNDMNISVPPMLLQPLVENCFKHTPLEVDKNSFIYIVLEVRDKQLIFIAENSQPIIKNKPASNRHGIGIENVKRRLDLYYDGKYTFDIFNNPDSFKIELLINL